MRVIFCKIIFILLLYSCSNINFLLENKNKSNFLNGNTMVFISGWDKPILKDILFLRLGEPINKRFLLEIMASETQTKRSINENQVAVKIDYKLVFEYKLIDTSGFCPEIISKQTSKFSFTPKSSGYNFASDVLLNNLFEEAVTSNVNQFIVKSNNDLYSNKCLDEK